MSEELIDLVDEKDRVIGTVSRLRTDNDPSLIHREVGVVLVDKDNKVLFQKRSLKKSVMPGFWSTGVAGHVDAGEDPDTAVLREMEEEIGFSVRLSFWKKALIHLDQETHFKYWYTGKYSGQEFVLKKDEVEEVRFMDNRDVNRLIDSGAKVYLSFAEVVKEYWNNSDKE